MKKFARCLWCVCWALSMSACASTKPLVSLQVLGSGGPELDDGRVSSSYLIWIDDQAAVLVDAGPGSSVNFGASGANFADLEGILLTHLHVDHSSDLPAFVKGAFFTDRNRDLPLYGPDKNALMPSTTAFVEALFSERGAYPYLQDYLDTEQENDFHLIPENVEISTGRLFSRQLSEDITLAAVTVHHGPVAALAWRVNIGDCSVTISGDMNNQREVLADLAKNTEVLVLHNAIPAFAGDIARNLHMTPKEMGKIAAKAKAREVLVSHRMNRTNDLSKATLSAMRESYSGQVTFANDMDRIRICGGSD